MSLKLNAMPGTAVAVETLEQYQTLMDLYYFFGWKSYSGNKSTEIDGFRLYGPDTVVCANDDFEINSRREEGWLKTLRLEKIISLEGFLKINGLIKTD